LRQIYEDVNVPPLQPQFPGFEDVIKTPIR
jgi:hypothetical protein